MKYKLVYLYYLRILLSLLPLEIDYYWKCMLYIECKSNKPSNYKAHLNSSKISKNIIELKNIHPDRLFKEYKDYSLTMNEVLEYKTRANISKLAKRIAYELRHLNLAVKYDTFIEGRLNEHYNFYLQSIIGAERKLGEIEYRMGNVRQSRILLGPDNLLSRINTACWKLKSLAKIHMSFLFDQILNTLIKITGRPKDELSERLIALERRYVFKQDKIIEKFYGDKRNYILCSFVN